MLIEQIIEFELSRPRPRWSYMYSYNRLFLWQFKNKNFLDSWQIFKWIIIYP